MKIKEADLSDKVKWDSFVDSQGGSFHLYFDWKYFYENIGKQYIPLMIETDTSQLIGILPIVKAKMFLHSTLASLPEGGSRGFLLRKDLSEAEKYDAISTLVKFVDSNYSDRCSTFYIRESITIFDQQPTVADAALFDNSYRYIYDNATGFPCTHMLELKQPFEEHIWNGLWSSGLRQKINRATRNGAVVIEDRELNYRQYL